MTRYSNDDIKLEFLARVYSHFMNKESMWIVYPLTSNTSVGICILLWREYWNRTRSELMFVFISHRF